MPTAYLSPANSTNSLYDVNRYSVIAKGGALPANDGTASRIALLDGITDFATWRNGQIRRCMRKQSA
jgi:hypothetical protein